MQYKFIKTKPIPKDNGFYYLTPLLISIPANVGIFIKCIDENNVYLQTAYITDVQAEALVKILGDNVAEVYTEDLDYVPPTTLHFESDKTNLDSVKATKELIKKTEDIPEEPPITYNYGYTNSPTGLYIRRQPSLTEGTNIGVLESGQRFEVDKSYINKDWIKITKPHAGYVYKQYTSFSNTPATISQRLVDFTASWEGFSPTPYKDAGGNWTVGFGDCTYGVEPAPVTYKQAWTNLENTLNTLATKVYDLTQDLDLNQSQFDSLVDFAYNLGINALTYSKNSGGLLAAIINCDSNQVILNDFIAWDHCDGRELLGLKRRRIAESNMFTDEQYNKN